MLLFLLASQGTLTVVAGATGKPRSSSHTIVSHQRPVDLVTGGMEGYHLTNGVTSDTADRLALALGRLQQDMNSALVRLQAMETLFMAQKEVRFQTDSHVILQTIFALVFINYFSGIFPD